MPSGIYPRKKIAIPVSRMSHPQRKQRAQELILYHQQHPKVSVISLSVMFELDKARIYQIIGVKKKRQEVNLPLGSKDPIYQVYRGMFQRCYDPKSRNYKNYGARGIEICLRWAR